jgi:hypothetical protein
MSKKSPPRLCVNLALDTVDGITFLNTEAFTSYMSKHDPIEIKPIQFVADKPFEFKSIEAEPCLSVQKKKFHIVKALD